MSITFYIQPDIGAFQPGAPVGIVLLFDPECHRTCLIIPRGRDRGDFGFWRFATSVVWP
jgi:hypothetical protein